MIDKARLLLKTVFGYDAFRPMQEEIIVNVLNRRDTLVIMPTGGGKSICYQIPALIFNGLTIVVSPLISLMKDQVGQLTALGIQAVCLNSSLSRSEYAGTKSCIKRGEARLLYLAPETLLLPGTLAFLEGLHVDCLTIDEAHCISEWGHEFRPEYRQLAELRCRFPNAVTLALTATATPRVQKDIKDTLGFAESDTFTASFNRENLFIQVLPKTESYEQVTGLLNRFKDQSGIIYCFSRKQVDLLSSRLNRDGFSALPYHAGLDDEVRIRHQEAFIRDDVKIMTATIAFGMGINKPNVRFVIHYDLPKNIESYYQQIGRAGRDGLQAHCMLLFGYGDLEKIRYFIRQMTGPEKRVAGLHLEAMVKFAETRLCRRIPLLNYFGEKPAGSRCELCDNCLAADRPLEDLTLQARLFLSCVKRAGEKFGAGHIIDILRGAESMKVTRFHHERLSTYGLGREFSKKAWLHYSRQFIAQDLVSRCPDHQVLKLTPKAWEVLKNGLPVMGTHSPDQRYRSRRETDQPAHDEALFDILRKKRKELADDADVPPYVIFPDKTLIEMSAFYPRTSVDLERIFGIGKTKMKRYGAVFLVLIRRYCDRQGIAPQKHYQDSV